MKNLLVAIVSEGLFSLVALLQDRREIVEKLLAGPYAGAALVPATPWLGAVPPSAPRLRLEVDGRVVIEEADTGKAAAYFAIWRRQAGTWSFAVQSASERVIAASAAEMLVVSAVDRLGNESARVTMPPPAATVRP